MLKKFRRLSESHDGGCHNLETCTFGLFASLRFEFIVEDFQLQLVDIQMAMYAKTSRINVRHNFFCNRVVNVLARILSDVLLSTGIKLAKSKLASTF